MGLVAGTGDLAPLGKCFARGGSRPLWHQMPGKKAPPRIIHQHTSCTQTVPVTETWPVMPFDRLVLLLFRWRVSHAFGGRSQTVTQCTQTSSFVNRYMHWFEGNYFRLQTVLTYKLTEKGTRTEKGTNFWMNLSTNHHE